MLINDIFNLQHLLKTYFLVKRQNKYNPSKELKTNMQKIIKF